MKVFSGSANKPLGQNLANELGISLSTVDSFIFSDGEKRIRIQEPVVDEDTLVIQSTNTPVEQNFMELFFIADGLKRSGARSVTAIVPYLGYSRQDHVFRDGEAVSLDVMIGFIEKVGIEKVVLLDPHSIKIPELFSIPVVNLSALELFARKIKEKAWDNEDSLLVSPDMGGIRRIKILSELLGNMPYIAIEKNRDLETGSISAGEFSSDVRKRAIIVDDMIASGKTIVQAQELLTKKGAEEVYVFATHAVFSQDCPQRLQESGINQVFVTDSIQVSEEKQFEKLTILSVAQLIADNLKS